MFDFNKKEKLVFLKTFRQTLYFILTITSVFFLHFIAHKYKVDTFEEHGVVETIQLLLLVLSGLTFTIEALYFKKYRAILFLLASLSFFASFRELDMFFDRNLPILSWKIAYIFPISALYYAYTHKKNVRNTLIPFYSSSAFYMMCCAMIIIIPISQCIGHGPFIRDILGDYRVGDIKEIFEESGEFIGYFLILLSSIEMYLGLLKQK